MQEENQLYTILSMIAFYKVYIAQLTNHDQYMKLNMTYVKMAQIKNLKNHRHRHKVIYHSTQTRALTVDMSHVMQPAGVLLLGLVLLLLQSADDDDDDARFTWQRL